MRIVRNITAIIISSVLAGLFCKDLSDKTVYDMIGWILIFFNAISFFVVANTSKILERLSLVGFSLTIFGAYIALFPLKINFINLGIAGKGNLISGTFDGSLFLKAMSVYLVGFIISYVSLLKQTGKAQ